MRAIKDEFGFYREKIFDDMLQRERKRTERSQKPFAMILVHIKHLVKSKAKKSIRNLSVVLEECFREIDVKGWYKDGSDIGIICPEVEHSSVDALKKKVESALDKALPPSFYEELTVSYICFPHANAEDASSEHALSVYPEFKSNTPKKVTEDVLKRTLDIIVAGTALALTMPILIIFGIAIKCTSKGPVFFKQKRIGFGGKAFTMIKFRTMQVNNDSKEHEKFVKDYINKKTGEDTTTFKLTNDKRITTVGKIMRKTSIDELPQFINVLLGNMSVVGPRPPIQYEVDEYHVWHRRRVMEVKPGITGFWQVHGRSTTSFETMVRMDIYYIKYRNIFLDILLILQTPLSLLKGAY